MTFSRRKSDRSRPFELASSLMGEYLEHSLRRWRPRIHNDAEHVMRVALVNTTECQETEGA
jgi:hypothetical protein